MTWISLRLGRRLGRVVLRAVAAYFVLFSPQARQASRDYLGRVFGRPAGWREVYRHVLTFGTTIHDRLYLLSGRFDLFDIRVHGGEHVLAALARGDGAFLLGGHLGSFEVVRTIGRTLPELRVAVMMYEENARNINAILATVNPAAKANVISLGRADSMLKARESLDEGCMIGMLADRTLLSENSDSLERLPFLGTPAAFPLGPLRMAAMLRRPVIFMTGLYRGGNRYDVHFEALADFTGVPRGERSEHVRAALVRYVALLEKHCRAAPYNWFNYFDFWQGSEAAAAPRIKRDDEPSRAALRLPVVEESDA
ncbi:LpxL/LpxP family acyltransferase [Trinickia mobilis]|uniref:LpxL/LpxP family acyltransferase n=1 Tax=Trinickia mobilis TaxID=2816356 RepID=UPI001A8D3830|nr:acyl-CoA synthetase [Trinickia mobilis]